MLDRYPASECPAIALRDRIASNITCEERTIVVLVKMAAVTRDESNPFVPEIEHAI